MLQNCANSNGSTTARNGRLLTLTAGLDDRNPDLLERWPHLTRTGPQPENRIGTLRDQLARARAGRQPDPETLAAAVGIPLGALRQLLLEILAPDIATIAADVARALLAHDGPEEGSRAA